MKEDCQPEGQAEETNFTRSICQAFAVGNNKLVMMQWVEIAVTIATCSRCVLPFYKEEH